MTTPPLTTPASLLQSASARIDPTDAQWLLLHALGQPPGWLFAHGDDPLSSQLVDQFNAMVERRHAGEPVAYITGRRGFWSLELDVAPGVLIPRPETELLVELALQRIPVNVDARIVDLGTGSGAIALALAHERPRAQVLAVDASADALIIAAHNAQRLGLTNVRCVEGDWFAPVAGEEAHGTLDMIVSNPPYIASDDPHLQQGDLRFEPAMALASGADGLDAIRRITGDAVTHLRPGGWLLFEHGWQQGDAVRASLVQAGLVDVATHRDLEQRDRVTLGRSPL